MSTFNSKSIIVGAVEILISHGDDSKDILDRKNRSLDFLNHYFTKEMEKRESKMHIRPVEIKEEEVKVQLGSELTLQEIKQWVSDEFPKESSEEKQTATKAEDGKIPIPMERVKGVAFINGFTCSKYTDGENEFLVSPDVDVMFKYHKG